MSIKIHPALLVKSVSDFEKKEAFHRQGGIFLRHLAAEIGLAKGAFDVRSNKGGDAASGEVTLHGESIYVQLSESAIYHGVGLMYRSCEGRKDYCGGRNNFVAMGDLADPDRLGRFVIDCKDLAGLLVDNEFNPALR